ncbi:MAG: hypothetical protein KME45_23150 [Stenomitos rutilans HA7619-LM2]|jgi:hypothetical protein|nr:hypothetical protein [Stenomitos rutilans HA7619-LM2]
MKRTWLWFKRYGLFIVWLVFLALMCRDYFIIDPPALGSSSLHNQTRDLEQTVLGSLLELNMLYLILQPRTINRYSIGRILGALCFSSFLLYFWFPLLMEGPSVFVIHGWWLFCINLMLVVALAISSVSLALRFLRKPARQQQEDGHC